jgi:hypothetical protein
MLASRAKEIRPSAEAGADARRLALAAFLKRPQADAQIGAVD